MVRFLLLALAIAAATADQVRYDGYQVIRIKPQNEGDLDWLHNLEEGIDGTFDFWQSSRVLGRPVDVMVSPHHIDHLIVLLGARGLEFDTHISDVQTLIDDQFTPTGILDGNNGFDYSKYHTYDEIQQWVADSAAAHSNIAESFQIATSTEGRAINGLKIGKKASGKPAVYFQGGIHAREWISPATVMYFTNQDRMWRKTRRREAGRTCTGIDPNRNYEHKWGGAGASTNACSDTYRGSSSHSEPEVAGSTSFLLQKKQTQDFHVFIDFHAYSQLWLAPWSYSKTAALPSDSKDHDAMGKACTDALKAVHGTQYTYGPSARTLYAASGCSVDWGYATLKAKYSYVVELRDTGNYGFVLPEDQIIPSGEETLAAVKELGEKIIAEFTS
ncbi:carboxypeptidase B-like [Anneissia japonica]|uniref:carboxypeptidase B-like n=1 Tax=Anneissia japonica TaxID=1529436 RepID=UPI0014259329|nr:carboxypeptidase B-like [Anneissia japonica]